MTQSCCSQVRGCYLVKPTEFEPSLLILKRDGTRFGLLFTQYYAIFCQKEWGRKQPREPLPSYSLYFISSSLKVMQAPGLLSGACMALYACP